MNFRHVFFLAHPVSLDWSSSREYFYTYILYKKLIFGIIFNLLYNLFSNFNTLEITFCQMRKNLEHWELQYLIQLIIDKIQI